MKKSIFGIDLVNKMTFIIDLKIYQTSIDLIPTKRNLLKVITSFYGAIRIVSLVVFYSKFCFRKYPSYIVIGTLFQCRVSTGF